MLFTRWVLRIHSLAVGIVAVSCNGFQLLPSDYDEDETVSLDPEAVTATTPDAGRSTPSSEQLPIAQPSAARSTNLNAAAPDASTAPTGAVGTASTSLPDESSETQGTSIDTQPPCDAVSQVFQISCNTSSGCHTAVGIGNFALGAAEAIALVDQFPYLNASSCGPMIDSANPLRSLIYTKITGDFPEGEGSCKDLMPLAPSVVTPAQLACLESWLMQFQN